MLSRFFLALLLTSSLRAEVSSKGNCSVSWELFKSQTEFDFFFNELVSSSIAQDKERLSNLTNFPLKVVIKTKLTTIQDKKEFLKRFDEFYAPNISNAITKQDRQTVFCNSQGVMIGNGQIWISKRGKKTGIIIINRSAN